MRRHTTSMPCFMAYRRPKAFAERLGYAVKATGPKLRVNPDVSAQLCQADHVMRTREHNPAHTLQCASHFENIQRAIYVRVPQCRPGVVLRDTCEVHDTVDACRGPPPRRPCRRYRPRSASRPAADRIGGACPVDEPQNTVRGGQGGSLFRSPHMHPSAEFSGRLSRTLSFSLGTVP